jgi:imidazole glycerol phosphate synthase subunit HisF
MARNYLKIPIGISGGISSIQDYVDLFRCDIDAAYVGSSVVSRGIIENQY